MRKWTIILAVAVLLVAGGVVAQQRMRAAPQLGAQNPAPVETVAVETVPARRGAIEQTLDLTGTVLSARRVDLTPKMAGRIAAVYVQEGSRVAAGQPIARLETEELTAQVRQAEENVRQAAAAREVAQSRLAALLAGARSQERAQAENAVRQAEAALRNAEAEVARMQQLFAAGAVSRQQLDAVLLQRDVARAQLDSARQQLSLVRSGAREEEVAMARAQVEQAEAAYGAAQAGLRLVRLQLENATIRAPFAGRIAELPVTVGEFIAPGMKVAVLYDDRDLEVEVSVGERDLPQVRRGQAATVRPDADPSLTLPGTVSRIQPSADPLTRAAKVRIRLADGSGRLLPGMSARVSVLVERRENVVVVPSGAIRQNGQPEVVVVKDGRASVRKVLLGLRHHHIVQILYGVAEGELVVTLGPESLANGQAVKVVNR
ncbi:MAG: efflux RND transporter periplasmic adaptor subunit [Armatimonadota bacterium]|nr:efflux RND transporter periplasmic adaptor subunit [Armatimonadota bacterium]MDR7452170.1 efflux RND transporter periplasmic adaptor subunit [Armatimonadota bacterium]MDR7468063.1 efflux RND transporter periplasmic adaptor subunit [Armatimonadota bacterium]MDR7494896.1 efflux RND transporter periplasmic adaptor subunit [Armatimonadota bacterium]MDR7500293.1 efflux RND transporter periplasmic adaptor subunit [Armatimonadota bacterium]